MQQALQKRTGLVCSICVSAWLLPAPVSFGQDAEKFCPGPKPDRCLSLPQLVRMSKEDLEQLYRQSGPGAIPQGYARGRAIRWPGTFWTVPMSGVIRILWHGKVFDEADCTLINQWGAGVRAIRAKVSYGPSWLDGQPAIIMDYQETSRVWTDVRDELREVAPGLYLGIMFQRQCPQPRFKMYFGLENHPSCCVPPVP